MTSPLKTTSNIELFSTVGQPFQLPKRSASERKILESQLPELLWIERMYRAHQAKLTLTCEEEFSMNSTNLPVYSMILGTHKHAKTPKLLITAGVHGVERIGTQVVLAWLESTLKRLEWDESLQEKLNNIQIIIVPIVNPTGMFVNTRANINGIDLNRNAPIDAENSTPFLGGGHRISKKLPWYRGKKSAPMERENQALERVIKKHIYTSDLCLSLDLHSGFGLHDRIWFPYAYSNQPISTIADYLALKQLWEKTYNYHNYIFEPQSLHYLSHGDLWDYFTKQAKNHYETKLISLTLELGSWAWVKKRPLQIFSFSGLFHPQIPHRHSRVLRRHLVLLDFLISASTHSSKWLPSEKNKENLRQLANSLWYKKLS